MSRPSTSTNTSTVDYTAEPAEITQLRNQTASATAACCPCTYKKDGLFRSTGHLQQLKADGRTYKGQPDGPWKGEVIVSFDGSRGTVAVYTRFKALNKTSDTAHYPGTIPMGDADLAARIAKIPPAIERAWNAKPYQLKITDPLCGERLFVVHFHVRMVQSGEHFTLDFVNLDLMSPLEDVYGLGSGRSYIVPPDRGKFNVGDWRSATDDNAAYDCLEPHEYGHMIGLIDEYLDLGKDRGGVIYEYPDGRREKIEVNDELMGSMQIQTAQPSRYCVTIAYAAIEVLESNGIDVTDCEIL